MSFWADKKVLVTSGAGFLGSYVVSILHQEGASILFPDQRTVTFVSWKTVERR